MEFLKKRYRQKKNMRLVPNEPDESMKYAEK